jgi:aryl-alcohol dehydrogenase-like predicted oxidoreductase
VTSIVKPRDDDVSSTTMPILDLATATPVSRIGLGLAAVGRPGYINVGHDLDLPAERSVAALQERAHALLDAAYANGVRYFDVARSYGRAEEFLAAWLRRRGDVEDVVVGSKWGYTYTANWKVEAEVHEVKDHGVATFDRQLAETRALLGSRLDVYHIHSVTPESTALSDVVLHRRLATLADAGVLVGLSTSGPDQGEVIRKALDVCVDGQPLFRSVQATWNLLETSAGQALSEAHDAGWLVILKEVLANGRLAARQPGDTLGALSGMAEALGEVAEELGTTADAVAIAAALRSPWVSVVLSGAATTAQLMSNLDGAAVEPGADHLRRLMELAEPAPLYWRERSALRWT